MTVKKSQRDLNCDRKITKELSKEFVSIPRSRTKPQNLHRKQLSIYQASKYISRQNVYRNLVFKSKVLVSLLLRSSIRYN